MHLLETVHHTIQQHNLVPSGITILVAVSGGPDSLALLHALHSLGYRLHVATLDHMLRGEAGAEDVRFVQGVARALGVPVTAGQVDVPRLMREENLGLEVAARRARYDFLAGVARQLGTEHIAVAHNAGDQAETVLMHLLRGSGVPGLTGMALSGPVPGHPDRILIRPLLHVTRAEIEAYCSQHDLRPRRDPSNRDTGLLRNYIRWKTIPHLQTVNREIVRALNQLADILAVESDYIERDYERHVTPHVARTDERVTIDRARFRDLHPALQRRFIYNAARETRYAPIVAAVDVAQNGEVGSVAQLGGGLRLRVAYEHIVIEPEDAPLPPDEGVHLASDQIIPVTAPGITALPGGWTLHITPEPAPDARARLNLPSSAGLVLRTRRPGDRFAPLGMAGHTQKLSEWMINRKIPRHQRDHLPLLVLEGRIVAIVHGSRWPISEHVAVRTDADHVLYCWLDEDCK